MCSQYTAGSGGGGGREDSYTAMVLYDITKRRLRKKYDGKG